VSEQTIRPTTYAYTFGRYEEPVATVRPGEIVAIYTEDAFNSRVKSTADLPTKVNRWPYLNPQTGPIWVEGAHPGDTLVVELLSIEPTRDFVVSAFIPGVGGIVASENTPMLNEPLPEQVFIYPLQNGSVHLSDSVRIPYEPFLGTIGTAPEIEAVSSLTPGPFGGNMDIPDVAPGSTIRIPISVEGGFFFIGDAHAAQGDGELCGVACEMTACVRLRVGLEDGQVVGVPQIESPTDIMAVGSAKPLEDAVRIAWVNLLEILCRQYGLSRAEAYQLVTQAGRMRVGNVVNPKYSVAARIPKTLLPEPVLRVRG
jgi:amidase